MIEVDCKSYIPCYICFKLHRRHRSTICAQCPGRSDGRHVICEAQSGRVQLCKHYVLYHKDVLLSIRAHKKGPAYGIPLKMLGHKCNFRHYLRAKQVSGRQRSYIWHKAAFFISLQITIEVGLHLRLKWRSRIDAKSVVFWWSLPSLACQHDRGIGYVAKCAVSHTERRCSWPVSNEGYPCCNMPLRCRYYATTFTVYAIRKRTGGSCTVTVIALKNLGHGRNPTDQPWNGQVWFNRHNRDNNDCVGVVEFL